MAEKLRTFDFDRPSELTNTEKRVYPWAEWFDGDIWQITHGQDFDTHPLMMERIIRTRAVSHKAKVRMRHQALNGDSFGVIVLQRTDMPGPAEVKKAEAREKRAAKKAAAEKSAAEFLATNGVETTKDAPKTSKPKAVKKAPAVASKLPSAARKAAASKAAAPSKVPSKRPAKRVA